MTDQPKPLTDEELAALSGWWFGADAGPGLYSPSEQRAMRDIARLVAEVRRQRDLAFFCIGCNEPRPVRWEDTLPGDIVCQECHWIIATFHPPSEVKP